MIDALSRRLPMASVGGAAAGLHAIAWLPDGLDEVTIADAAASRGVAIHAVHQHCAVTADLAPALVLGYGLIGEAAIPRAIRELAKAVGH